MHLKTWLDDKEAKMRLENERKEQAVLQAAIKAEEEAKRQRNAETRSELSKILELQVR